MDRIQKVIMEEQLFTMRTKFHKWALTLTTPANATLMRCTFINAVLSIFILSKEENQTAYALISN